MHALRKWLRWRRRLPAIRWASERKAAEGIGYYWAYLVASQERRPVILRRLIRCRRQLDRLVQLERGQSPWSTDTMPEAAERATGFRLAGFGV